MNNYNHIRTFCHQKSDLSRSVIDDFLVYYAAAKSKVEGEIDRRLTPFDHIVRQLPEEWVNMVKSQYIAHRIFKKNGLIHKYLNHSALKDLRDDERAFLETQAARPWRFNFSRIVDEPAPDFFNMYDIFTEENYLLYSHSLPSIIQEQNPLLWFNLIGFNGDCWQTYGPVVHFNGFESEDILFFAREANTDWYENGDEVMEDLEENPVPFMMLITGSNMPLIFHDKYQFVSNSAEYEVATPFNSELFRNDFIIEYSHGVYKLSLNGWSDFPHYSTAFTKKERSCSFFTP